MGSRRGVIYITALVAVLVIAGTAMVMARGTVVALQGHRRDHERTACRLAAEGMLRAVIADLDQSLANGALPNLAQVAADGEEIGDCLVFLIGRDPAGLDPVYGLRYEGGLVDINNAPAAVLAHLPGGDSALAAAIIDWRDTDDEPQPGGGAEAGDAWYATADVPYAPRNAPFEDLSELRLLRDMDDTRYFGEDRNRNGLLDDGEDHNHDGQLDSGLRDACCIEHREPATAPDGSPRLSVTAITNRMRGLLIEQLGEERGTAAYTVALAEQPFTTRFEFLVAIAATAEETAALWPLLSGQEGRLGLIDAWSCDNQILAALVGAELANDIIAARPDQPPADPSWLIALLEREQAATAGLVLTSGSYRLRADILAVHRSGRTWYRLSGDLDCSAGSARLVRMVRSDREGWPLPWIAPTQLASLGDQLEQTLRNPP